MALLLVRHASAGDRAAWEGPDRERPLDKRGRARARELVAVLKPYRLEAIFTSPARRCLETVGPLARARDVEIEVRRELSDELHAVAGAALVRSLAGRDVVVCGHGGLEQCLPFPVVWKKGAVLVVDAAFNLREQH